ncbi:putative pre-mRNA splicing factor [Coemansia reversa NRRL 1564]|uniref:Putative pre-mRNA splicing factor n=1 Tax=Coemansia reversa (strain ATCC 12441 / NRRL 1564) TaxID=763665 RepID=A0A2G5B8B1_COERN|nr:putative pre-mRNA splicing factor [Coemansia reversa NRRL 1564]|eukprot:PIA15239.1 putative pre-mRNA splicing factor [Coemansia reversa NRRL 1564]
MAEFDRRRLARSIAVPTGDAQVKEDLRQHGHPICLFGEDAGDRRNRLRYVLSKLAVEKRASEIDRSDEISSEVSEGNDEQEEFYTEASGSLLQARQTIARFSLSRAQCRIKRQRDDSKVDLARIRRLRQDLTKSLTSYTIAGSQIGDARPMSRVIFTRDSQRLLTSAWSGTIKLWDIPGCNMLRSYRGHTNRIGGLSLHPQAGERGELVADFASGAADNNIFLWSLEKETPVGSLKGHQSRVVNVDHHPSGDYLGSASFDGSWRLWDIATERELLLQEGHSRELFALRFQCDGSLVGTAGLDGIGRVWDMRSGRSVMALEGHAKEIFALDWSPNGYQIATGSADNTVRIFDLRKLTTIQQIPAHKSVVTDVRFFHARNINLGNFDDMTEAESQMRLCDGQYLASASNDGLINIWTAGDWKLQKSLAGHVGKILGLDIAGDSSYIASVGYDKTFKIWAPEEM